MDTDPLLEDASVVHEEQEQQQEVAYREQQEPQQDDDDTQQDDNDNEEENHHNQDELPNSTCLERIALILLTTTVWSSGILFGLLIIGHYLVALGSSTTDIGRRWNTILPFLYSTNYWIATTSMGMHLTGGAITIILGAIQLLDFVRIRYPTFHRWTGHVYLIASIMTAVGGFAFIWLGRGCIGGRTMDLAFSLLAILTVLSCIQTWRHAVYTKQYEYHQLWSWRLYSLMISSWLYRMEYATVGLMRLPHDREHFSYALDYVMDFLFYIPNFILVEILWRTRNMKRPAWVSNVLGSVMITAAVLLIFISTLDAIYLWIPGMMDKLTDLWNDDDDSDEYHDL